MFFWIEIIRFFFLGIEWNTDDTDTCGRTDFYFLVLNGTQMTRIPVATLICTDFYRGVEMEHG